MEKIIIVFLDRHLDENLKLSIAYKVLEDVRDTLAMEYLFPDKISLS